MKKIVAFIMCLACITCFQLNIAYAAQTENVFQIKKIDDALYKKINGVSWSSEAPVKIDELRLVVVIYYGFDEKEHQGEFIVHKNVASDVVKIFKTLLENKFPIEKINLVDNYGGNDDASMDDNNSSAYNFRKIAGSKNLSKHSYGIAIDINPIQNPWVKGAKVYPQSGADYINRDNIRKGMIVKNDVCYNTFKKYDWSWGGEWTSSKDYQHFEKSLDSIENDSDEKTSMLKLISNTTQKINLN